MTFCYLATFDATDPTHGFGNITLSTAGKPDVVVNVATQGALAGTGTRGSNSWNHYPIAMTNIRGEDASAHIGINHMAPIWGFPEQMRIALRAAATTATWVNPNTIDCVFSTTTLRYTISYTHAPLTAITFANVATRQLFGFAANFSGSSSSVAGTYVPRFCIQPTMSAVSTGSDALNYDPEDLAPETMNAYGQRWGLHRSTQPLLRVWTQEFETYAKTLRRGAVDAHPSTFQELFEVCRTSHPFIVLDGWGDGRNEAFYFSEAGAHFSQAACTRVGGEMDATMFRVRFDAVVAGRFIV